MHKVYVNLEDLMQELEARKIPSHICEESTLIMGDIRRAIEKCRKIDEKGRTLC